MFNEFAKKYGSWVEKDMYFGYVLKIDLKKDTFLMIGLKVENDFLFMFKRID